MFGKNKYPSESLPSPHSIYYRLAMPYRIKLRIPKEDRQPTQKTEKPAGSGTTGDTGFSRPTKNPKSGASGSQRASATDQKSAPGTEVETFERSEILYIPNRHSPTLSLDIKRAAFVNKTTTLTFQNGILTASVVNKPSEVSAALDIPLAAVRAIVALPTQLIQLKIDTTKKYKGLVDAQKEYIAAQEQYINALRTLKETEKAGLSRSAPR